MKLLATITLLVLLQDSLSAHAIESQSGDDDVKIENVRFYLYVPANKELAHELWSNDSSSVLSSGYDFKRATKFVTHGISCNSQFWMVADIREAFLSRKDDKFNVVMVDWGEMANSLKISDPALTAKFAISSQYVARRIARMVDLLVELGSDPREVALIGHSGGAVISTVVARYTKSKVGHLVVLDPPRVESMGSLPEEMSIGAKKSDAHLVEIVYTQFAIQEQRAHASYYPNGGLPAQPGCNAVENPLHCSHLKAGEYFAEAVRRPELFVARKCQDYKIFLAGGCDNNTLTSFPNSSDEEKEEGRYYLRTSDKQPFGLGKDWARSSSS